MGTFDDSPWAAEEFSQNYLENADIYIVERRRMFRLVTSLCTHFFRGRGVIDLLDLGCGDGVLSGELLSADPLIRATLVDGSETMLERAGVRLRRFAHLRFVRASLEDIAGGKVALDRFDLCVSSLAIHHLGRNEKAALYQWVLRHLKEGGRFVNIDVVLPPSEDLDGWYGKLWKEWMIAASQRAGGGDIDPDAVIRRYKDPSTMNRPDLLDDQIAVLRGAGYAEADCYYKNGIFAVFGGKR